MHEISREELQELIASARELLDFEMLVSDDKRPLPDGYERILDLGIALGIQVTFEKYTQKARKE